MGCYSQYGSCEISVESPRRFFTKSEKVEMLKEYQSYLEKEAQGVKERIAHIESDKSEIAHDED